MAKKRFFRQPQAAGTLAMVLALVFGLVLAGCGDNGDPSSPGGSKFSGTIKMAQAGINQFTLTLTGGLTWKDTIDILTVKGLLQYDGPVTAEGADANHPKIQSPYYIKYTAVRTSDTVITFTMSKDESYWGSGKLKLKSNTSDVPDLLKGYNKGNGDTADITVASDSVSVDFNIAR